MKKRTLVIPCFLVVAGIMAIFFSCQSERTGGPVSANHDEQLYGYLYNSDGSPARNAKVVLVASDYIPSVTLFKKTSGSSISAGKVDGVTDQDGRYSFSSIPEGTYNIFGEDNGNASYHPSVSILSGKNSFEAARDTLNLPGSIQGIVFTDTPSDSRKIFILIIGGYIARWPDDSAGNFNIKNMAAGTYKIRFLTADTSFKILDTVIHVSSGEVTDLGKIVLPNKKAEILKGNYTAMKFGIIFHFNMSTFDRNTCDKCYSVSGEWGLGQTSTPAKEFNPTSLDCGQWADAAKAAGAKYMVLTVKHHDGFCLWPSKYTDYCVKNAGVKTDVVKEFVDSARSRGMKVGFYYSIRDLTNGYSVPFIKNQLTELLSNYGEVTCMWFDGWGWGPGYKAVPYDAIIAFIKSIQPNCLIVENNHEFNTTHSEIIEYEMPIDGPPAASNILPAEGTEPICLRTTQFEPLWFWHPISACTIKSPQSIVDQMNQCNDRRANYLLNVTPDTSGQIPQCQVDCLKSVGTLRGIN
jgi:alpha-L-fucosidase